jgi:hypothetical protein
MTFDEFQVEAEKLAGAMRDETLAAEAVFQAAINKPLPPKSYPNTSYWDVVGPMINGYRWNVRRDQEEAKLNQAIDALAEKYYNMLVVLEEQMTCTL